MPKKKSQVQISDVLTKGRLVGIFYLIFAMVLIAIPNIVQCACTGWNIINPLCWIGWLGCSFAKTILAVIGWIGGLVLILLAIKNFISG